MSTTGLLGSADSRLANIVLGGAAGVSPPPGPPPPTDTNAHPPFAAARILNRLSLSKGPKFKAFLSLDGPPGAIEAAAAAITIHAYPFKAGPRVDGPHRPSLFLVEKKSVSQPDPPVPTATQINVRFTPAIRVGSRLSLFPFSPTSFPVAPVNPAAPVVTPPTVPPPPPPPQTGVIGPPRQFVPQIPRAPAAEDPRVRPHIDKVATLLNDLQRKGYIKQDGNGSFVIIGGGFALPRAPVATDDRDVGAVVGSTFVDTTTDNVYICVNNSVGSARWKGPL